MGRECSGVDERRRLLIEDASASRNHFEIRIDQQQGVAYVIDTSTNGTRLNGVRLNSGQWPLRQRDLIQLGDVAVAVDELEDPKLEESLFAPQIPPDYKVVEPLKQPSTAKPGRG